MFLYSSAIQKAASVREGEMVSWNSSGGKARGKVIRVVREGTLSVPKTTFKLKGDKDNPAVLIRLYRDGEATDTQVGHKMSSLSKSVDVIKHASHDQQTHGRGGKGGGGGGGGGGGKKPSRVNPFTNEPTDDPKGINPYTGLTFQQEVTDEIGKISDNARNITNELENNPSSDPVKDLARTKTFTVRDSLDKAFRASTPKGAKEGLQSARRQISPIVDLLEDQNYNDEAASLFALGISITSTLTKINRGS